MPWKKDGSNLVLDSAENPIWVSDDGKEITVTGSTIPALNAEAKANRIRAETAETALKKFDGIDPEKARTAITTVEKIDQKKLIDAGEVDKVREQITASVQASIAEKDKAISELRNQMDRLALDNDFSKSEFIKNQIAIPADMFRASFERNFSVENGRTVAKDSNGNPIYSTKNPGQLADVDEALAILVDRYPHKNAILKGGNQSGSGSNGGGSASGGGPRLIKRADFVKMSPVQQQDIASKAGAGEVKITD